MFFCLTKKIKNCRLINREGGSMDDKIRKRRLIINRLFGIFVSLAIVLMLVLFLFKMVDPWMFGVCVLMFSGMDFMLNASIAQTKETSAWPKINAYISGLLFIAGIVLVIFGVVTGNLILF